MREIVLDTETTGLNPDDGHRIIEIGCIELINHLPTGNYYHTYINPQRDVPAEASAVSGITTEFLKPHPLFVKIVDDFLHFIEESPLIIHNAGFDMKFLNSELSRLCRPTFSDSRAIDTLIMARKKFPGSPASLDALCRRFNIDTSSRTKHGALIDAKLLADVYLELIGGRQTSLSFGVSKKNKESDLNKKEYLDKKYREPRVFNIPKEELLAHKSFIKTIPDNLWNRT